jgi:recombination protein RecR
MLQSQTNKSDPISKLVFELSKLPGIGERTATRLSYFILKQEEGYAKSLAEALLNAKRRTGLCQVCYTFTDQSTCRICSNPERNHRLICVVERPADALSIEQSGAFKGVYHILHGALSPLEGVGPEDLKIQDLFVRLEDSEVPVEELVFAMNPSVEGEATTLYLAHLAQQLKIKPHLSQLAHGLPVGGMLEYTDRQTIGKALENRMEMS